MSLRNFLEYFNRRRKQEEILREKLAELEHIQWAQLTKYILDHSTATNVARWRRQIDTPYGQLTEEEKDKDREWADKVLKILKDHAQ